MSFGESIVKPCSAYLLSHIETGITSKATHSFREADMLHSHDEGKHVSTFATYETPVAIATDREVD
jgi:hypothetical protein